jgi:hypothetical protein
LSPPPSTPSKIKFIVENRKLSHAERGYFAPRAKLIVAEQQYFLYSRLWREYKKLSHAERGYFRLR